MVATKYKKLEDGRIRSVCVVCNKNPQKKRTGRPAKDGLPRYRATCSSCQSRLYESKAFNKRQEKRIRKLIEKYAPYKLYKENKCKRCGFIPEHLCQLEVDHIDGNHNNNDKDNLQTLCANCHRLKTYKQLYLRKVS